MNKENNNKIVVCQLVGTYGNALTRGKEYVAIAEDEAKQQIKMIGDNRRVRWFPMSHFLPAGSTIITMVSWNCTDEIIDREESSLEHVELAITCSNGETRWCSICTLAGLSDYLERNMEGNVCLIENQIVVRNFSDDTIAEALQRLDQQDQLITATKPLIQQSPIFE